MKRWSVLGVVAAGAMAFGSLPAQAKPLPEGGMTMLEIVSWLQTNGFKAQVHERAEDQGGPYIQTAAQGVTIFVIPDNCQKDRCASVLFGASFELKDGAGKDVKSAALKMNEWNRQYRWARAYIDDDRQPFLAMDVSLTLGGTTESLDYAFSAFGDIALSFEKFIGW